LIHSEKSHFAVCGEAGNAAEAMEVIRRLNPELAIVDLREELIFSQSHLLFARSVPLSRLELKFPALVPRTGTRIVLCDDGDGLVERIGILIGTGEHHAALERCNDLKGPRFRIRSADPLG